jgi:arylsulfatase A-like enzyme
MRCCVRRSSLQQHHTASHGMMQCCSKGLASPVQRSVAWVVALLLHPLLLFSSCRGVAPAAGGSSTPPHLIFCLVDDLGYYNVGFHNPDQISPEIDALAAEGVVLEAFYTFKYCSPTRSSFLSGRLPIHVNQLLPGAINNPGGIDLRMTLLPQKLKQAGYLTHQIGKWHCGARSVLHLPVNRGFDSHFGFLGGGEDHYQNKGKQPVDLWRDHAPAYGENGTYSCELYSTEALRVVTQHDPKDPLFLYVAYQNTHTPYECPVQYQDPAQNFSTRRIVQGMLTCVSISVGNLTRALKSKGMWDTTLFVFSGDNVSSFVCEAFLRLLRLMRVVKLIRMQFTNLIRVAHSIGDPITTPCGMLFAVQHQCLLPECLESECPVVVACSGGKWTDFQGGIRNPAFAAGGWIPAHMRGSTVNGAMHIADMYTTFCSLAGVADCSDNVDGVPPTDGIDVTVLFQQPSSLNTVVGNATSPRHEIVISSNTIIVGEWKYVRDTPNDDLGIGGQSSGYWTGPVWPWSSNHSEGPGYEPDPGCPEPGCLFHLPSDPEERHECGAQFPAKLQELVARLKVLAAGQFQTGKYTAGYDRCFPLDVVAAAHHNFVAPPCVKGLPIPRCRNKTNVPICCDQSAGNNISTKCYSCPKCDVCSSCDTQTCELCQQTHKDQWPPSPPPAPAPSPRPRNETCKLAHVFEGQNIVGEDIRSHSCNSTLACAGT